MLIDERTLITAHRLATTPPKIAKRLWKKNLEEEVCGISLHLYFLATIESRWRRRRPHRRPFLSSLYCYCRTVVVSLALFCGCYLGTTSPAIDDIVEEIPVQAENDFSFQDCRSSSLAKLRSVQTRSRLVSTISMSAQCIFLFLQSSTTFTRIFCHYQCRCGT